MYFCSIKYFGMKIFFRLIGFSSIIACSLIDISCNKDTTCKVNVKCIQASSGAPVSGADVKLYAPIKTTSGSTVTADVKAEGTTNADGVVSFNFKLPAIFNISATRVGDSLSGTGLVTLEAGKTVDAVVQMKHQ